VVGSLKVVKCRIKPRPVTHRAKPLHVPSRNLEPVGSTLHNPLGQAHGVAYMLWGVQPIKNAAGLFQVPSDNLRCGLHVLRSNLARGAVLEDVEQRGHAGYLLCGLRTYVANMRQLAGRCKLGFDGVMCRHPRALALGAKPSRAGCSCPLSASTMVESSSRTRVALYVRSAGIDKAGSR